MRMIDMERIVRITGLTVDNFKSIKRGSIKFSSKNDFEFGNILGLYGQNGSGKTAIVQAIEVLQMVLNGEGFPTNVDNVINIDSQTCKLKFYFEMDLLERNFNGFFEIKIVRDEENFMYISSETIQYKRDIRKEKSKGYEPNIKRTYEQKISYTCDNPEFLFLSTSQNKHQTSSFSLKNASDEARGNLIAARKLTTKDRISFLLEDSVVTLLPDEFREIIIHLKKKISLNTFVVTNENLGLIYTDLMLPLNFFLEKKNKSGITYGRTGIPGRLNSSSQDNSIVIPTESYETICNIFKQTNEVLPKIIPNLTVSLEEIGTQTLESGKQGTRIQFIANRTGKKPLPFSYESDGVKKITSVLSLLTAMFNDPNVFVVIDELDAAIYEYLLGDVVKILNNHGRGQLLFTSHNLRVLEVLGVENIMVTTTNEMNRFIHLKDIKETNNLRRVYLRAIQLGGQDEAIYEETDSFDIQRAFKRAGEIGFK